VRGAATNGWAAVAAGCAAVVALYMTIFAVPPLATTFTDERGLSNGEVGLLMSVYLIAYGALSLPAGALGDRFGNARVMTVALLVAGAASVAFSLTTSLGVWLVLRGVVGACTAVVFTPGIRLAAASLPRERASSAAGFVICSLSAGTTIAFLLTGPLEDALGWRWPFRVYGAVCLAGVVALAPFARAAGQRRADRLLRAADLRAVATVPLAAVACTLFVVTFVIYGVLTWAPAYLDEVGGFSAASVTLAATLMAAATIPASVLSGWAADRTGRPLAVTGAGMGACVPVVALAFATRPAFGVVTLLAIVAGFGSVAACIPLFGLSALVVRQELAGLATGAVTTIGMTGAVTSTYLGGILVDATGDYDLTWISFAVAAALAGGVLGPLTAATIRRRGALRSAIDAADVG
jgi:sugar phosphate permease